MAFLDLDAGNNRFAIYTGNDDAPLTNPLGNLPRVKWHGDFPYVGAEPVRVVTTDVNPRNWSGKGVNPKALFAHGKSFRPLVFGSVTIGGERVPIMGNFLAKVQATYLSLFVYTTTTHVMLDWDARLTLPISTAALSGRFEIYVCNMGLTSGGSPVFPPEYAGCEITPTRFRAGSYDTDDMHFAADAAGPLMFYRGASMFVQQTGNALAIKHAVPGGYSVALDTSSAFVAPVVRAKAT